MTPRVDIVAIGAEDTLEQAVARFQSSRHSRLPVHEGGLDRVVGVLPVRDLLAHLRPSGAAVTVRELMRPVPHVPATKHVLELLRELQEERQQIAVVVDEYGATAGIVSLEDLVEEIVGEIRDEHEQDEAAIRPDEQGGLLADGLTPVADLAERLGRDLQAEGVGSVGGLVFARLGRAPRLGDKVEVTPGVSLEVVRLRGRRIGAVRVECKPTAGEGAS
jgi:putative hemolysin